MSKRRVKIMLDSGVFSAANAGIELNLKNYIGYVKDVYDLLDTYVNMDHAPFENARNRALIDYEATAVDSYRNLQIMKEAGLRPIPVFHQGERFYWLERMLKDGEDYIGISANKDLAIRINDQCKWYDDCFSCMTNTKGYPLVKVHGFGVTVRSIMKRYPWTTVDSSTWALAAGYGKILVPPYIDGAFDYLKDPIHVGVTGVLSNTADPAKRRGPQRRQFIYRNRYEQECTLKFLNEVVGVTLTQARYDPEVRRLALLRYYLEFQKALPPGRFLHHRHNLFARYKANSSHAVDTQLSIAFVMAFSRTWAELMSRVDADHRLLSYYDLMPKTSARRKHVSYKELEYFVRTGLIKVPPRKNSEPKDKWNSEYYLNRRKLSLHSRLREV